MARRDGSRSDSMLLPRSIDRSITKKYWNCFYRELMPCTKEKVDLDWIFSESRRCSEIRGIADRMIGEEWNWRANRRMTCQDDWKPNPQWNEINNDYMAKAYHHDRQNQYFWDYEDEKNGIV